MEFLKIAAMALVIPVLLVIMLVIVAIALAVGYVAWLCGVPVKVKTGGKTHRYRWLQRVY